MDEKCRLAFSISKKICILIWILFFALSEVYFLNMYYIKTLLKSNLWIFISQVRQFCWSMQQWPYTSNVYIMYSHSFNYDFVNVMM